MSRSLLRLAAAAAAILAGCGADAERGGGQQTRPAQAPRSTPREAPPQAPRATPSADPFDIPAHVPLRAEGPADAQQASVVRAWTRALRSGDVAGAAALWALPSRVQNGTPVVRLTSRAAVRAFNASLPCGAVLTGVGGADGFTVTTVRLTDRPGGGCGSGAGGTARTAIRVRGGRIVEWYRLPDDPARGRRAPDSPAEPEPGSGGPIV